MTIAADGSGHGPITPSAQRLAIVSRSVANLKPHERNPRTHSKKQIRQIAESLRTFGWTNPVLLDGNDRIIAGHGRIAAAKLLGMTEVPTIRLDEMSEAQVRAYIIADNKLAENAGWDHALLRLELAEIALLDAGLDLTVTGFEIGEIDVILDQGIDPRADVVPEIDPRSEPISKLGDLWLLGDHRLLCGDARDAVAWASLMDGGRGQMVFTDPPYNVPTDGNVGGLGQVKHENFVMAAGEMSEAEFVKFLSAVIGRLIEHSANGAIHYLCMDWRHMYELPTASRGRYAEFKNLCVWNKTNGGMGSFYRSKHELVFVFKSGAGPHINNFELGQHGRHRTNVWDYAGINSLKSGRMDELRMHPTVKPVALAADAIKDCSKRHGIILDHFVGSGTTLIAAEQTRRRGYGLELDPKYVDTAIRRWQNLTGERAINAETGLSFAEIESRRPSAGASCAPRR